MLLFPGENTKKIAEYDTEWNVWQGLSIEDIANLRFELWIFRM